MSRNHITDRKSFIVYKDWEDYICRFPDDEIGKLFKALFAFACRGEDTNLDGALDMLFDVMKHTIERDGKKWEEICVARSHSKKTKAAKATDNDNNNDTENNNDIVIVNDNVPPKVGQSRRRGVGKNSEHSYDLDKLIEHALRTPPTIKKEKEL